MGNGPYALTGRVTDVDGDSVTVLLSSGHRVTEPAGRLRRQ